ncbi:MAG: NAD(P)-dependent alcohol dehydrogenase [Chloroflexi bacterium]|nr:MAG: NAD(P)-dependent alcohol dehydrogenase [Chloroflexota bacterium]
MKAVVQDSADVLRLQEIQRPAVAGDDVLVRVHAASVNALDWHSIHGGRMVRLIGSMLRQPFNPVRGVDMAGTVEAVGENVTLFRPGDEVFGTGRGTFAEYAPSREQRLVAKPSQLTFAQASTMGVAAVTALQGLRDRGELKPGQRALINGAGGGVGTFAVQIAKALGAHVTAVTSTRNLDLVRSMDPDEVIDYTQEDVTKRGERYDVVLDVAANRSFSAMRRVLTPSGRLVVTGAAKGSMLAVMWRSIVPLVRKRFGNRWLVPFLASVTHEDLLFLKELAEAGKLRPVIDREYSLGDAAEAVRYVGTGQARAKVVINIR